MKKPMKNLVSEFLTVVFSYEKPVITGVFVGFS